MHILNTLTNHLKMITIIRNPIINLVRVLPSLKYDQKSQQEDIKRKSVFRKPFTVLALVEFHNQSGNERKLKLGILKWRRKLGLGLEERKRNYGS